MACLFKIDSILIAAKRPGRPKGSTNKSKLKPVEVTTLLEPETIDETFEAEETSNFSRSDLLIADNSRLKRTRVDSELEPSDGARPKKSDRRNILYVGESSTKVRTQPSQTSTQAPTFVISQTKYSDQIFQRFQDPVQMPSSNSQECTKDGPLLSHSSNSVPCYAISSSKYQDPNITAMYQAIPSTSNGQSTSYSLQNSDLKIACEIPPNDFSKNKFD